MRWSFNSGFSRDQNPIDPLSQICELLISVRKAYHSNFLFMLLMNCNLLALFGSDDNRRSTTSKRKTNQRKIIGFRNGMASCSLILTMIGTRLANARRKL